jgi:hypothetical protein
MDQRVLNSLTVELVKVQNENKQLVAKNKALSALLKASELKTETIENGGSSGTRSHLRFPPTAENYSILASPSTYRERAWKISPNPEAKKSIKLENEKNMLKADTIAASLQLSSLNGVLEDQVCHFQLFTFLIIYTQIFAVNDSDGMCLIQASELEELVQACAASIKAAEVCMFHER